MKHLRKVRGACIWLCRQFSNQDQGRGPIISFQLNRSWKPWGDLAMS